MREPNAPAFLSKHPNTSVFILASIIAPPHIMHGSLVQNKVHPVSLKLFNNLEAPSIARISAWAVGDFFCLVRLWATEITLPFLSVIRAPTGTSSSSKACIASTRQSSIKYS
ncbi:MAG TPA: hypothetical protein PKW07_08600 [Syntrophorhabdaceae bacterium]|nr:hypothetical protein [Syntrophorhabdaceae bacterium]